MRKNLLIIGGIAAGLVLACVVGIMLYALVGRSGVDETALGFPDLGSPGAAPEPEVVVEKLVEAPPTEPGAYDTSGLAYAAERLIIRSGNISMVVKDTRAALATIEGIVEGMAGEGAFVVSADEHGGAEGSQPYITISIRVPASRFDETMDHLADLAVSVTSRSESAQDVTEEYVDLEARQESLETARQRLLEIMQDARSTKDLLEAEQQLTQREAEIESLKGRMQYLEQSARLSSIWIELQPYLLSQPVGDQWRPAETARRAVETLLEGLKGFGDFLIFFAIAILPWLAAIGLVIFLIVRLVRWRARRTRARQSGPTDA
ncbi:MAG: DUF4349 domain-containing protein [Anaerolineae bacterium]|jgi:hypothetical protein